ncbi:uncharacterized protein LOC132716696 [Ruditapes philippinarum]|uniref:uncharacterized protein LOC132716696 n=1 Tax=Ruditapes philippinarum TaxID=129788 RepID=UPI00295C20A3|nr:uncharacterized protein LOC132716696 [Ruditapes philippinarum]
METSVASTLQRNPIIKVTGDNLDIYVRTGHKSLERSNQDIHLFASNIIFSRIVKPGLYSMVKPLCDLQSLTPELFFPSEQDRESLRRSYCVMLARILMGLPTYKWMRSVVPSHIYHPYQRQMSQRSEVFQLPIQMKNESKHEDCVDILDGYEDILTGIYNKAFGSDELFQKFKVVVGGDQLTRVRLEEAKLLRALATSPKRRFDDLQPFVVELWHVKQDFLEVHDYTVYNYSCNLCHWFLHLIHMEDVVREGDVIRLIPTLKYSLQFFFSHSRLSKYFVECLDFILKTEYLLSQMQRMRVLEGAFVNLRGGLGQNIECDLVKENSVRNQKDLIRALGANKTNKAIYRSTKAADTVADICSKVDESVSVKKQSTRHQIPKSVKDEVVIHQSLRALRPFFKETDRNCQGMLKVAASPLMKIDTKDFKYRIHQVVSRLFYGQNTRTRDVSDDEYDDDD